MKNLPPRSIAIAVLLPLAVGSVWSCESPDPAPPFEISARDSAGVRVVSMGDPRQAELPTCRVDDAPQLEIGVDGEAPGHDLFRVRGGVRLSDGRIALANAGTSEVRIYDGGGSRLLTFGRRGDGPGEFNDLAWIGRSAGDTLVVYDTSLRRLTWFSPEGEHVRTRAVDGVGLGGFPEAVGMSEGGLVALSGFDRRFGAGERRDSVTLYFHGRSGELVDSAGPYPGPERYFHTGSDFSMQFQPLLGRTARAHATGGRTAIGSTDDYAFDVYDGRRLTLRIRAATPDVPASPALLERQRDSLRERSVPPGLEQAAAQAVAAIPARATLPAFADIRVDREGGIWVREHPAEGGPQRWTLHDREGVPIAGVELPPSVELLDQGPGWLLVLTRDAYDVEAVRLLGMAEPCPDPA